MATYRYKDMLVASSTEMGQAIANKAHPSVIEIMYRRAKAEFLKDYPTCTDEWFARMNNGITNKTDQGLSDRE